MEKKIVSLSMIVAVALVVSLFPVNVAQAESKYCIVGYSAAGDSSKPTKLTYKSGKLYVSGYYGKGSNWTKAEGKARMKKNGKKCFAISGKCKVKSGDEEIIVMSFSKYVKTYGKSAISAPWMGVKIKNDKVIKIVLGC